MSLIVDRSPAHETPDNECSLEETERTRIDVTDLHAGGIEAFVESSVDTDYVSLETRGARTYLVLEE
ncbi:hypothetical protein [Natrarchaeobius chitinivorans]|uniref:Uncharacterized protein n=1 Tax=Natrarchaeobius chitinivorans TaxID=1679083 RepID=A0A3N6PBG4_NATCH|nr:hypothetical protein [Natrarchaeobius chitinivorans]RQG96619.1 hypothetical protein EA473_05790 [Natrarchaeobius chitinivorans]